MQPPGCHLGASERSWGRQAGPWGVRSRSSERPREVHGDPRGVRGKPGRKACLGMLKVNAKAPANLQHKLDRGGLGVVSDEIDLEDVWDDGKRALAC